MLKVLKIKINVDGFPSQKYKIASRTCLGIPIVFVFSAAHFSFFRLSPTVCSYKKLAIFTTNVHTKHKCLFNHKCVCGAPKRHFCQTPVTSWAFIFCQDLTNTRQVLQLVLRFDMQHPMAILSVVNIFDLQGRGRVLMQSLAFQ